RKAIALGVAVRVCDARLSDRFRLVIHKSLLRAEDLADDLQHRVIILVYDALFQRNDGVVGDMNVFRTDLSTTLRDVAISQAHLVFQCLDARGTIEWMHLECCDTNEEAR